MRHDREKSRKASASTEQKFLGHGACFLGPKVASESGAEPSFPRERQPSEFMRPIAPELPTKRTKASSGSGRSAEQASAFPGARGVFRLEAGTSRYIPLRGSAQSRVRSAWGLKFRLTYPFQRSARGPLGRTSLSENWRERSLSSAYAARTQKCCHLSAGCSGQSSDSVWEVLEYWI